MRYTCQRVVEKEVLIFLFGKIQNTESYPEDRDPDKTFRELKYCYQSIIRLAVQGHDRCGNSSVRQNILF